MLHLPFDQRFNDRQRLGMISAVSMRLLYLIFQHLLGLLLLMGRACGCPKLRTQPLTCSFVPGRYLWGARSRARVADQR